MVSCEKCCCWKRLHPVFSHRRHRLLPKRGENLRFGHAPSPIAYCMFVDKVRLTLTAGNGGNGVIAWRREKFVPKGGPCGGDGGKGGSIVLEADDQVVSLENYRNRRLIKATNGQPGGYNHRHGKKGDNLVLKIPYGTLVKDALTGEILYDFIQQSRTEVICKGGIGGKGISGIQGRNFNSIS